MQIERIDLRFAVGASALALWACAGTIDPAGSGPGPGPDGEPPKGGVDTRTGKWAPPACNPQEVSFTGPRLWQISDVQYGNVVRDVLGVTLTGTEAEITAGADSSGEFSNYSENGAIFTDSMAQNYERAAQEVSRRAATRLQVLIGSATAPANAQQLDTFIKTKVARLWRRPLVAEEITKLAGLYNAAAAGGATEAFSTLLQAVLQAPSFLFRTELGPGDPGASAPFKLTPYETATAISMFLLETAPDDALWAKAQDGSLASADVVAAEVDRLMALPAAQENLALKVSYWLGTERIPARDKDAALFAAYTPAVKQSVYQSGRAFVKDIVSDGKLSDLFTSSKVFVNRDITTVYGIPGGTGTALTPVMTTLPERSAGILTQPAFIAAAHKRSALTDPIHLGLFVFQQLICGGDGGPVPDPPADAFEKAAMMMGTERELVAQRAMLSCGACHKFDPFGLTFQTYDAIGRFNTTRQVVKDPSGKPVWTTSPTPIDTSAIVPDPLGPDLKGPLADVRALAQKLNSDGPSRRVAYCSARWLSRYALGTDADVLNSCALQSVWEQFHQTGSFKQLFRGLATSPGFVTRSPRK